MTNTQLAAHSLAQALAGFRLAERDANQALTRLSYTYALVRTRYQIQP